MAGRPSESSETRERRKRACDMLVDDVDDAVNGFMDSLNTIAKKHGWCIFIGHYTDITF
jgi:polysaccharide deacetylase 2 family uncharacterized protein YibQ